MYEKKPTRAEQRQAKQRRAAEANYAEYIRYRDAGEHKKFVARARKQDKYYRGDQWEESDRKALEDAGRPALTINLCLNKINTVIGEQISKRVDASVKPKGNGATEATAISLNALLEAITEENQYDTRETLVFSDGVIQERGFFDLRLDFSTHIAGEARIRVDDPLDILIDPDSKEYDPDTWGGVIETRLYSLDEIELEFGKKKRVEIERICENQQHYLDDSITFSRINTFGGEDTGAYINDGFKEQRSPIRTVRVINRQYWRIQQALHFVDPELGDMKAAPAHWSDKQTKDFAAKMGLLLIRRPVRRVRWTVSVDHVLLHDDWSPYRHFTKIPYFCYFRRGKPFGIMTNLISPQDNLNKLSSQILSVVNSTANSGWVIEEDSLVGMDVDELEKKGASTGLVVQYQKGSTRPEKIQANSIPTGLDRMKVDAGLQMNDISGVDDVMSGTASAEFSGIALGQQEARGIRKLSIALDNLRQTRYLMVRNIIDLVQDHYREQRIIYIRDKERDAAALEEVIINERDAAGRIINDISIGNYEFVIASRPSHDTFEDRQFIEAVELRNAGVAIPDHWIVRYSSLENKEQLEKMLANAAGFGEMTPEEQRAAQLEFELGMLQAQGAIEKLEAEINELEARANLNNAKAEDLLSGDDSQSMRNERMKLEGRLAEKRKEFDLRRELAVLTQETARKKNDQDAGHKEDELLLKAVEAAEKPQPQAQAR